MFLGPTPYLIYAEKQKYCVYRISLNKRTGLLFSCPKFPLKFCEKIKNQLQDRCMETLLSWVET